MILGIAISAQYDASALQIKRFYDVAAQYGISCVSEKSGQPFDVLVVFGGDGTLLRYARKYVGILPLFGVNMGTLGFLAQAEPCEASYATVFERLLKGQYCLSRRTLLTIEGSNIIALNEILLCNPNRGRAVGITARLDGKEVGKYVGDGVIVCTPTGSTGLSLSSLGAVLTADSPCFMLNPSAVMGSCPPIVYRDDATLTLTVSRNTASLYADGELQSYDNSPITIVKYGKSVELLTFDDNFFSKLNGINAAKDKLL